MLRRGSYINHQAPRSVYTGGVIHATEGRPVEEAYISFEKRFGAIWARNSGNQGTCVVVWEAKVLVLMTFSNWPHGCLISWQGI